MIASPEYQGPPPTEEDAYVWLHEAASEHTPGERRTDDEWPESFWLLADKVAEQKEVLPEDADRIGPLYEEWQNELNAAEAMETEDTDPE